MIERIKITQTNNASAKQPQNKPQFRGGFADGVLGFIQTCEKHPMVNVTVLDVTTAIGPRSLFDTLKTNIYAGLESFRRESSGLIVNCLIPSFVVLGVAKTFENSIMGRKTKMGSCWANQNVIEKVAEYWKEADGKGEERAANTLKNMIKDIYGADRSTLKAFKDADIEPTVEELLKAMKTQGGKDYRKVVENAHTLLVNQTHASEHIKFKDVNGKYFSEGLSSLFRDTPKILKEFIDNGIHDEKAITEFIGKSKKLINTKSVAGLAIILPLAASMQYINRWITKKTSGKDGAPIYKDFAEGQKVEMTPEEKKSLAKQKVISIASMIGVGVLSMMKWPNMGMFQFKGMFPSMDQARLISTATFASRMAAAEDENELREATLRDIATFSSFYFLGDYVAKGIATAIQKYKPEIELINVLDKPKADANIIEKFVHWAKHTSLKSSDEVLNKAAKNARSACQIGNIAFSLIALGVLVPLIGRSKTDKNHEEKLKKMGVDQSFINKYYPPFTMNKLADSKKGNVYQAFMK